MSYSGFEKNSKMLTLFFVALVLIVLGGIIKCTDSFITDIFNLDKPEWLSKIEREMDSKNLRSKIYQTLNDGQFLRWGYKNSEFSSFEFITTKPVKFRMYVDGECVLEKEIKENDLFINDIYRGSQKVYYDIDCREKTGIYLYSDTKGGVVASKALISTR